MLRKLTTTLCGAFLSRDPVVRHGNRHSLVSAVGRKLGIAVYNRNLAWQDDQNYKAVWERFAAADGQIRDRKYILYSIARSLARLPGDTAECGVFDGGSSYLMCHARRDISTHPHHIFDSFAGLSPPQPQDKPTDPTAYQWKAGDLSVSEDVVAANLSEFDFVRLYKAWIPERFPEVSDRRFSLVHIDVDLYQPTLDSLLFFYERLVPGGLIVCDDYGFTTCPGSRQACDTFAQEHGCGPVIHLTTGQGLLFRWT